MPEKAPNVGLFVTCLADLFRPTVGFAAVRLLEAAGCRVHVPLQSCCGQPAYNAGDRADARALARQAIRAFEGFDYVVAPSGSCAGMLSRHYPELLKDDPAWSVRARRMARKCFELTAFLADVMRFDGVKARLAASVTYHDSCSGLRELGIRDQPRALLAQVDGLSLVEGKATEECCGFGGTFCVKYAEVSVAIVDRKIDDIVGTGTEMVLAGDLGCLLNIAGRLHRRGAAVQARHVAEVLADMCDEVPAIGAVDAPDETA
jgi:L-lactate dehydrogenase complex protein LldE